MIQLFKLKSLKNNTNIEQGAENKNAKKQRGRSMVEMLGVLAIIGVLSIGGIQGYTIAMRRYQANNILDSLNKYAAINYSACQAKMQRDPVKYKTVGDCTSNISTILKYEDTGLGQLPNGLVYIIQYDDGGAQTVFYYTNQSHDVFVIDVLISSKELCQTLATITDSKPLYKYEVCEYRDQSFYEGFKGSEKHKGYKLHFELPVS